MYSKKTPNIVAIVNKVCRLEATDELTFLLFWGIFSLAQSCRQDSCYGARCRRHCRCRRGGLAPALPQQTRMQPREQD